jgi:hypothetical protein
LENGLNSLKRDRKKDIFSNGVCITPPSLQIQQTAYHPSGEPSSSDQQFDETPTEAKRGAKKRNEIIGYTLKLKMKNPLAKRKNKGNNIKFNQCISKSVQTIIIDN